MPFTIVFVERTGVLKAGQLKSADEIADLYKKCGFKSANDFKKQTVWKTKVDGQKYIVHLYAKTEGKANSENKYDFPPPVDNILFFGKCALLAQTEGVKGADGQDAYISLTVELWEKIYEKLFGGFENLQLTHVDDEDEEDELDDIPAHRKTKKGGYLKDGFVVDTESDDEGDCSLNSDDEDEDEDEDDDEETTELGGDGDEDLNILEGSELSEEDYSDDEVDL
jgi:hypothetical protein